MNNPKIRFVEFKNLWRLSFFKDFMTIITGKRPNNLLYYISDNPEDVPYPVQSDFIRGNINTSNKYFKREHLSVMKYYSEPNLIMSATCNLGQTGWVVLSEYVLDDKFFIIKSIESNIVFVKFLLDTQKFSINKTSQGNIIAQINKKQFLMIQISIPNIEEQTKIAQFFTLLDKQIQLIDRKIELYELRKKYYLNNIFSNNNKNDPKIRFKNFNDKYTLKSFKTVFGLKMRHNKNNFITSPLTYSKLSNIPVYDQSMNAVIGYYGGDNYYDSSCSILFGDHTRVLKKISGKSFFKGDGVKIIMSETDNNTMLYYYLSQQKIINLGYSRHFSLLQEKSFIITDSSQEQNKIAEFFIALDQNIQNIQKKKDVLLKRKKYYLNNMFV